MAVASAEPYASYLHFAPEDNHTSTSEIFMGRMPFLTPNQQRQGTEGKYSYRVIGINPKYRTNPGDSGVGSLRDRVQEGQMLFPSTSALTGSVNSRSFTV